MNSLFIFLYLKQKVSYIVISKFHLLEEIKIEAKLPTDELMKFRNSSWHSNSMEYERFLTTAVNIYS